MKIARYLPSWVKQYFQSEVESRGYVIPRDLPPVDLRELSSHPIDVMKRAKQSPVLLNIPLTHCRALARILHRAGQTLPDSRLGGDDGDRG